MTERQEEQSTLEALHMLEANESRIFASEIKYAPKVIQAVKDLRQTAGELAYLLPSVPPPSAVRTKVMNTIINQPSISKVTRKRSRFRLLLGTVGWVGAIAFGYLFFHSQKRIQTMQDFEEQAHAAGAKIETLQTTKANLEQQLAEATAKGTHLADQLTEIRNSNSLVGLDVTSLRAQLGTWNDTLASVVWDSAKQEGMLKLTNAHPMPANRDLQLWVFDKDKPVPVSAGVVHLKEQGPTVYTFKPASPVTEATKFAVSSEEKGGSDAGPKGPVIMASL